MYNNNFPSFAGCYCYFYNLQKDVAFKSAQVLFANKPDNSQWKLVESLSSIIIPREISISSIPHEPLKRSSVRSTALEGYLITGVQGTVSIVETTRRQKSCFESLRSGERIFGGEAGLNKLRESYGIKRLPPKVVDVSSTFRPRDASLLCAKFSMTRLRLHRRVRIGGQILKNI